jgi:NADPH-dependent curcumin reductase CurA
MPDGWPAEKKYGATPPPFSSVSAVSDGNDLRKIDPSVAPISWFLGGVLGIVVQGLENAPCALIGLFHGDNIGKRIVQASEGPTK